MSSNAHVQHLQIDQYNTLNLESVQAPEEPVEVHGVRGALQDPIFRLAMTGFATLFTMLGIAAALTF